MIKTRVWVGQSFGVASWRAGGVWEPLFPNRCEWAGEVKIWRTHSQCTQRESQDEEPRWGRSPWRTGKRPPSMKMASPETLDFRASHYSQKSAWTESSCQTREVFTPSETKARWHREVQQRQWRGCWSPACSASPLSSSIQPPEHETLSFQSSSAGSRPDRIRFGQSDAPAWDLSLGPS